MIETVNVQYSCTPMINWDRKLRDRCPPHTHKDGRVSHKTGKGSDGTGTSNKGGENGTVKDFKGGGNGTGKDSKGGIQKFIVQHPAEAIIAVAGVGAGIAAIAGAPILVIVGVGIGIGMATKYALTLANHTLPFM